MDTETSTALVGIGTVILGLVIYFAPTLIAGSKRNANAIFALNLLLGWTLVGWVVALVWSLVEDKD